jgi:hypothetical protein
MKANGLLDKTNTQNHGVGLFWVLGSGSELELALALVPPANQLQIGTFGGNRGTPPPPMLPGPLLMTT